MAEVTLPELGESITDGVITAWLVEVGDTVEVDQPIVEISTDKVDTEIPSPVAGTIQELRADVDDTIEVGQVIAVIGEGDADATTKDEPAQGEDDQAKEEPAQAEDEQAEDEPAQAEDEQAEDEPAQAEDEQAEEAEDAESIPADEPKADKRERPARPATTASAGKGPGPDGRTAMPTEAGPLLTSPLVRRLLREARVPAALVKGTGPGGRITREDAEQAIATGPTAEGLSAPGAPPAAAEGTAPSARDRPEASPLQVDFGGERTVTQDLTRMRKAIASAMMGSLHSTAQLTAAVEVDVTALMTVRAAGKDDFKARHGASLSPLPIVARAACMTIPRHPALNASIDTEAGTATFHRNINLGIAVDTERGLLVPNIKGAQDLSVPGLATAIADLAKRTREKQLKPDDVSGGTFTITNTGSRGTLFDTPILNPPEVAILATCAIEKRPVVVSDALGDAIAIRWMTYLCLTYDHRMVDGADAARFLQDLKWVIETYDFTAEVMA